MNTDAPEVLQNLLVRVEDLNEKLNTLMTVVKSLNGQMDVIDSRLMKLERPVGLQEESMRTQTSAQAEPAGPEQPERAH